MAFRGEDLEFNLKECSRKCHSTRENPSSRRFSASCIQSFREDHNKFSRTNFIISNTASSPSFSLKEEIDPSNYSFTNALKALQAKTMHKKNWDWLKQDQGIELNSKWNEAEKYICNPYSGEVPMECLSSKTLNSRSFRNLTTTTISSAPPLTILPSSNHKNLNDRKKINIPKVNKTIHEDTISPDDHHVLIQDKKVVGLKRESAPVDVSSGSLSPLKKPPVMKRHVEAYDSSVEGALEIKTQQEDVKLEEEKQNMITEENQEGKKVKEKKKRGSGCFSFVFLSFTTNIIYYKKNKNF